VSVAHSDEKNVSPGAASRDGHAAQATPQHQQQQQHQDDARKTFRPLNLTSGKFNFNINSFLRALHPGNAVAR